MITVENEMTMKEVGVIALGEGECFFVGSSERALALVETMTSESDSLLGCLYITPDEKVRKQTKTTNTLFR